MRIVLAMLVLDQFISKNVALALLGVGITIVIGADILRQKYAALNDFIVHNFGPIMRQNEAHKLAGTSFLIVGVTLVVILFPRDIVSLTLLFLCFADPLASYVGIRFGKEKILGNKTIQGFLAAFVTCMACAYVFLSVLGYPKDRLIIFSVLAGLVGSLAELIPIANLDDNFTLPVVSAVGLYILFYFFGFFA